MVKEHFQEKEERQILVFRIAREELGLDISCVREVLRPQEVYHLPKAPDFIEGVRARLKDKQGKGTIQIAYCSNEDQDRLLELLTSSQ